MTATLNDDPLSHEAEEDPTRSLMPPHQPERPIDTSGLCGTCVTPGYCSRTGDCAQGKQIRGAESR